MENFSSINNRAALPQTDRKRRRPFPTPAAQLRRHRPNAPHSRTRVSHDLTCGTRPSSAVMLPTPEASNLVRKQRLTAPAAPPRKTAAEVVWAEGALLREALFSMLNGKRHLFTLHNIKPLTRIKIIPTCSPCPLSKPQERRLRTAAHFWAVQHRD